MNDTPAQMQATVSAIWAEVLRTDAVGPDDDFFALGGSSLLAVRMLALVAERTGRELPIEDLLQARTVRELTTAILAAPDAVEEEEGAI